MKLTETPIAGAWLLEIEPVVDARGFFARSLCVETLAAFGLEGQVLQQSISFNQQRGTLRGMHYQQTPYEEVKLVRVTRGSIYDVILDLRSGSPSYLRWYAVELSADNRKTLYIPRGVVHGFQTLEACSEVFYQMTQPYMPDCTSGVRWNDPVFAIDWPLTDPIISDRDSCFPDFKSI